MADEHDVERRERGLLDHLPNNNKKQQQHAEVVIDSTHVHASSKVEVKKHAHLEHIAEAGVMLGGAMAMYEKHQAKKNPEHAHKHKIGEAIASAVVAGSGVLAKQEHNDKKQAKEEGKHHLFGHHSHK